MSFCPHCGFNLERDQPVERDGFVIDPRGAVRFCGHPVRLTPAETQIMHTLAAADGRSVRVSTILERLGCEDAQYNRVSVSISKIKRTLTQSGIPFPIRSDWGRGYRWEARP